jgi:hypothetical protein
MLQSGALQGSRLDGSMLGELLPGRGFRSAGAQGLGRVGDLQLSGDGSVLYATDADRGAVVAVPLTPCKRFTRAGTAGAAGGEGMEVAGPIVEVAGGLVEPAGLALDEPNGFIFVSDATRIVRLGGGRGFGKGEALGKGDVLTVVALEAPVQVSQFSPLFHGRWTRCCRALKAPNQLPHACSLVATVCLR